MSQVFNYKSWNQATRTDKVDQTTLLGHRLDALVCLPDSPWLFSLAVLLWLTDWHRLIEWCPNNSPSSWLHVICGLLMTRMPSCLCAGSAPGPPCSVSSPPSASVSKWVQQFVCLSCFGKAAGSVSVSPLSVERFVYMGRGSSKHQTMRSF